VGIDPPIPTHYVEVYVVNAVVLVLVLVLVLLQ